MIFLSLLSLRLFGGSLHGEDAALLAHQQKGCGLKKWRGNGSWWKVMIAGEAEGLSLD